MRTVNVQLTVPEEMTPYLRSEDIEHSFEGNVMLLFPFMKNIIISHVRTRFYASRKSKPIFAKEEFLSLKHLLALSALLAVSLSSAAYGKIQDFGKFTVNAPKSKIIIGR